MPSTQPNALPKESKENADENLLSLLQSKVAPQVRPNIKSLIKKDNLNYEDVIKTLIKAKKNKNILENSENAAILAILEHMSNQTPASSQPDMAKEASPNIIEYIQSADSNELNKLIDKTAQAVSDELRREDVNSVYKGEPYDANDVKASGRGFIFNPEHDSIQAGTKIAQELMNRKPSSHGFKLTLGKNRDRRKVMKTLRGFITEMVNSGKYVEQINSPYHKDNWLTGKKRKSITDKSDKIQFTVENATDFLTRYQVGRFSRGHGKVSRHKQEISLLLFNRINTVLHKTKKLTNNCSPQETITKINEKIQEIETMQNAIKNNSNNSNNIDNVKNFIFEHFNEDNKIKNPSEIDDVAAKKIINAINTDELKNELYAAFGNQQVNLKTKAKEADILPTNFIKEIAQNTDFMLDPKTGKLKATHQDDPFFTSNWTSWMSQSFNNRSGRCQLAIFNQVKDVQITLDEINDLLFDNGDVNVNDQAALKHTIEKLTSQTGKGEKEIIEGLQKQIKKNKPDTLQKFNTAIEKIFPDTYNEITSSKKSDNGPEDGSIPMTTISRQT